MRLLRLASLFGLAYATVLAACSSGPAVTGSTSGGGHAGASPLPDASTGANTGGAAGDAGPDATAGTGGGSTGGGDAGQDADAAAPPMDTLDSNRDRLLGTYLDFLKATATQPQSNGLSGSNVATVCDVWKQLAPSPQAVFLTITARLQGSILGDDGSSMLFHITKLYRIAGGQNATATDPGSCGGGEYNRLIMSQDTHLHASQLAANTNKGVSQPNGKPDIADIPAGQSWRDSHDLGGPHAPFNLSDETNQGAPRGQTQYFTDPSAAVANVPLGRMDLTTLVDPYAVEMDEDYDCVHNSNPSCAYTTYGPLCFPEASEPGTTVFTQGYGSFEPNWQPSGCGN